jgi:hypothetical protein
MDTIDGQTSDELDARRDSGWRDVLPDHEENDPSGEWGPRNAVAQSLQFI